MPAEDGSEDEDGHVRQTYNFAPGSHGLIYRASTSDRGASEQGGNEDREEDATDERPRKRIKTSGPATLADVDGMATSEIKYKLQSARWGLIPFWTKRPPDYASQMRTINCRDDSLLENRGMWNTMKQRKRCVVIAEGFYEWLKKNEGKEKLPHFIRRADTQLMCFAGLWDAVRYEGSEETLYTYTIITTDSNASLKFLHDRMPVILEPGSETMKAWLDPQNVGWSKELQAILKPFRGELDVYPVDKAVGKVGNNSPSFVVPIDSKENKNNIANFFAGASGSLAKKSTVKTESEAEGQAVKREPAEERQTVTKVEGTEDNAPMPKPEEESEDHLQSVLQQLSPKIDDPRRSSAADDDEEQKIVKRETTDAKDWHMSDNASSPAPKPVKREDTTSTPKKRLAGNARSARNATSNETVAKTPKKDGNAKITSFFGK